MAVYVDNARIIHRRMKMSHMLADTEEELHAMAKCLGLKREWFQAHPTHPHYDICDYKRAHAVRLGAVSLARREVVALLRRLRECRQP